MGQAVNVWLFSRDISAAKMLSMQRAGAFGQANALRALVPTIIIEAIRLVIRAHSSEHTTAPPTAPIAAPLLPCVPPAAAPAPAQAITLTCLPRRCSHEPPLSAFCRFAFSLWSA